MKIVISPPASSYPALLGPWMTVWWPAPTRDTLWGLWIRRVLGWPSCTGAGRGVEETRVHFGGQLWGFRNCSGTVVCNLCGRMETTMAPCKLGLAKCCVYRWTAFMPYTPLGDDVFAWFVLQISISLAWECLSKLPYFSFPCPSDITDLKYKLIFHLCIFRKVLTKE